MLTFGIKGILLLLGLLAAEGELSPMIIGVFLTVLTCTALSHYLANGFFSKGCLLGLLLVSLWIPPAVFFLPLMVFDAAKYLPAPYGAALFPIGVAINWNHGLASHFYLLALLIVSNLFSMMHRALEQLDLSRREARDDHEEHELALKRKHRELLASQDHEVHVATLRERNRIARDIHDNVGHGLSRAILQTGALQALNQDPKLTMFLEGLLETLNQSMDSIRGSVHDLKDDAMDLHEAAGKVLAQAPCQVHFDYDISSVVGNEVKFCFLTILKEALTNIAKHSDASEIQVTMQEHPALYQLLIWDNGGEKKAVPGKGIGLLNIEERVSALNGYCHFSYQNGFRIFITVPKT